MLEHGQAETECRGYAVAGGQCLFLARQKDRPDVVETAALQVVLAGVVAVEGRAPDIGLFADVLDGDGLIALLHDQGEEGVLQKAARAGDAPVDRRVELRVVFFQSLLHFLPVTRHCRPYVQQQRYEHGVQYRTLCATLGKPRGAIWITSVCDACMAANPVG